METTIKNTYVDDFFRFLKNWDNKSKTDLIIKLNESMNLNQIDSNNFSDCFGKWADDRTADEIIENIMLNRINNREIDEF